MNQPLLILLATLVSGMTFSAPSPPVSHPAALPASPAGDSNIVISNKTVRYIFDEGSKEHPVIIHQQDKTTYYCSELRTEIPWSEFYDDQSSIDDLKIYLNGSRDKTIQPKNEYYSSGDIFLTDEKICYFSLPFLKKGTSDEVELEKTTLDPRYFSIIYFTEDQAVQQKTVEIVVPKWMHVDIKEMNFAGYAIQKTHTYDTHKDADVYMYTMSDLPAWGEESNSPGPTYIYPHLLVLSKYADLKNGRQQYFNDVKDQYAWYRSLVLRIGNDPVVMKAKALEITKGITGDLDKVKAVYQWVQENIRYIAFENGIAGFCPDKAQNVLAKRYGDCKGMANLTKNLLTALGFDARLCWIGTDHIAYDYSTPSLAVDNHMICALNYHDKIYFLDATESYIGFGQYAQRIQGRQVLIENGDNFLLQRVPVTGYEQNEITHQYDLHIEGSALAGKVHHCWKGENKEDLIFAANSIHKNKLEEAMQNFLSHGNASYRMTDFLQEGLDNRNEDLNIRYNLVYADAATAFDKDIYVDMDFRKEFSGADIDSARQHDFLFECKQDINTECNLTIPAGYKVQDMPPAVTIQRSGYSFYLAYQVQGNVLKYRKTLIIKDVHLPKSSFPQWNADIAALKKAYQQQVTLTQK